MDDRRTYRIGLALILITFLSISVMRIVTPDDLGKRDQERPISYILDVVQNDNWLCPRDASGMIASKPPMHPWIAAGVAIVLGRVDRAAWLFPSLLTMLATTLILYEYGRRRLGLHAALLASMAFLLSHPGFKMVTFVRTDPLFACVILINALLALHAWETGRGWHWFWFVALINTMVKGPLGVLLALTGLLAMLWERRSGHSSSIRGPVLPGFAVWALLSGGWLYAAWHVLGDEVIREMIGRELVRHAAVGDAGEPAITRIYQAPFYLFSRFFPWSLFTIAGIVRVIRHPAADAGKRRFERFLTASIFAGLVIFSFAGHQRPDLVFPLVPAAASLAASALADRRWLATPGRIVLVWCVWGAVLMGSFGYVYGVKYPTGAMHQMGAGSKQLADVVEERVGLEFPLIHVDAPLALQIYLDSWRHFATHQQALRILAGDEAAFVAVSGVDRFLAECHSAGIPVHTLLRWDDPYHDDQTLAVLGNRERLEWDDPIRGFLHPFAVTYRGVRPEGGKRFYLERDERLINGETLILDETGGSLQAVNLSERRATLRLRLRQGDRVRDESHELAPGEELVLSWSGRLGPTD